MSVFVTLFFIMFSKDLFFIGIVVHQSKSVQLMERNNFNETCSRLTKESDSKAGAKKGFQIFTTVKDLALSG